MPFTFEAISVEIVQSTLQKNAHRASEPRDTIYTDLAKPFIESGIEHWAKPVFEVDDEGNTTDNVVGATGFTWADFSANFSDMCDMIARKEKEESVGTIAGVLNQHANRQRWHVFAKTVKADDGTVGLILVNEKVETERMQAEKVAREAAKTQAAKKDAA